MADAITTTATTLEGQALEIARALQTAEAALVDIDNAQIVLDLESKTVSIAVTLPITLSGTGGSFQVVAGTYLIDGTPLTIDGSLFTIDGVILIL